MLDIGASDGFFSFAAERRAPVECLPWTRPRGRTPAGWGPSKRRFRARGLNSKVEDLRCDLHDLTPELVGTFDVVLFLGVLYHMEDPLSSLRHVARLTNELLSSRRSST